MSLRNRFKEAVLGNGEPDVQTENRTDSYAYYSVSDDVDRIRPNQGNLERYWDQYISCPLVRVPIDIFAEDVTAPGYQVSANNDELANELEEWLAQSAIVGGESHRDFSEILDGAIVQEAVRGTALVEVVPKSENPDEVWGFRLINVSTVNAYTYDDQAVLLRPDDTDLSGIKTTRTGKAAAYGQWDDKSLAGPFNDKGTVPLSQDDVIKLVNDPDTSEIFGNSTIAPVSKEIDELLQMLDDVSEAIHSKGYPLWLFKLGDPQGDITNPRAGVWPDDKIKGYRDEHKNGNWSTDQKDFVPGDVDVERVEGEVPEIEELLDWYAEQIIAATPVPKAKVGFAGEINRDITSEQIPQYERKVESKRRRLQEAFTPILRRKATELGYDGSDVSSVELKIEEATEPNPLKREDFNPSDFAEFCRGIQALDPEDTEKYVSPDEIRAMLGLPGAEQAGESALEASVLDEEHEEVQAQFEELYGEPIVPDAD